MNNPKHISEVFEDIKSSSPAEIGKSALSIEIIQMLEKLTKAPIIVININKYSNDNK